MHLLGNQGLRRALLAIAAATALFATPQTAVAVPASGSEVVAAVPGQPATASASQYQWHSTGSFTWTAPSDDGGSPITGYALTGLPSGTDAVDAATTSYYLTGLQPGTYTLGVAAVNEVGTGPARTVVLEVPTWATSAPPGLTVATSPGRATVKWTPPANEGGATPQGWRLQLFQGFTLLTTYDFPPSFRQYVLSLTAKPYTVRITQLVSSEHGTQTGTSSANFTVPPATVPTAPTIGTPSSGTTGGAVTASTRWAAPTTDGGRGISGYKVIAYKLTAAGNVAKAYYSPLTSAAARAHKWTTLPTGRYKFKVIAYNAVGKSPASAYSAIVVAR